MMRRHILRHTVTAEHKLYEGLWFNHPASIVELHPLAPIVRKPPAVEQIDRVAVIILSRHYQKMIQRSSIATSCHAERLSEQNGKTIEHNRKSDSN